MSSRVTALAFALAAIALTLAQELWPAREWYHGWQYVVFLAVAVVVTVRAAWLARRGPGRRFALAMIGAAAVAVAGLLSGLIGPDTVTIVGTPGTVTPIPDLGVAAFFNATDPARLARGDAAITLRRRDGAAVDVGTRPVPFGLSVVFAQPRPAAYVEARDARGDRLTVTQPTNASFLSPVILFRQSQNMHDRTFPLDTFAVPALHRVVRVLYFSPADLAAFGRTQAVDAKQPAAVLSIADDNGAPQGITLAASGRETNAGGLRTTITIGTYPVLEVASAPQPYALLAGLLLFVLAGGWSLLPSTPSYSQT